MLDIFNMNFSNFWSNPSFRNGIWVKTKKNIFLAYSGLRNKNRGKMVQEETRYECGGGNFFFWGHFTIKNLNL